MSDGIEAQTILKIAFLDKPLPDNSDLNSFLELYDIVITESGDLSFVNEVIGLFSHQI